MDLSFVGEVVAETYGACRRLSHDPQALFHILFLALLGNRSDRRCEEQVKHSLAGRWFAGLSADDDAPYHTALCQLRDRPVPGRIEEIRQGQVWRVEDVGPLKWTRRIAGSAHQGGCGLKRA